MITAPESGNGTLSKVTPGGEITNIAVIEGNFIGPGICVDNNTNILITAGDKLLSFSTDGKAKIIANGFSRSFDVKVDNNNNIFVADDIQGTIYKILPSGKKEIFYKCDTSGSFVLTGLVFDSKKENLYVREAKRILKFHFTPEGVSEKPIIFIDNTKLFYLSMDNNVNLAPADLPKEAASFDLPIALGILAGSGQIAAERLDQYAVVGELALDGATRPTKGALSMSMAAAEQEGVRGTVGAQPQRGRSGGRRRGRGHPRRQPGPGRGVSDRRDRDRAAALAARRAVPHASPPTRSISPTFAARRWPSGRWWWRPRAGITS